MLLRKCWRNIRRGSRGRLGDLRLGDLATGREGDWATWRWGDLARGRLGDCATGRGGDLEMGRKQCLVLSRIANHNPSCLLYLVSCFLIPASISKNIHRRENPRESAISAFSVFLNDIWINPFVLVLIPLLKREATWRSARGRLGDLRLGDLARGWLGDWETWWLGDLRLGDGTIGRGGDWVTWRWGENSVLF